MIFQHTTPGQNGKCQTTRLADINDALTGMKGNHAVRDIANRTRWHVGRTYAIQPGRGKKAIGRIRVTSIEYVPNPFFSDLDYARREGFATVREWQDAWRKIHGKNYMKPAWAIGFELVKKN